MFGHTLHNCRKRNKIRIIWREVTKGNATSSDAAHHQPLSPDHQEDFIKVLEKHIVRSPRRTASEEQTLTHNHFQALIEYEVPVLSTGAIIEQLQKSMPPMDNILAWNVRGLNWLNKQEDVSFFLQFNKIGFVGLLETKIKSCNIKSIANRMLRNWHWHHNADFGGNGRILQAWKANQYVVTVLDKSDQLIHNRVTQLSAQRIFYIIMVYGHNTHHKQLALWANMKRLALQMGDVAWCLMGDFNVVLSSGDRIGGGST